MLISLNDNERQMCTTVSDCVHCLVTASVNCMVSQPVFTACVYCTACDYCLRSLPAHCTACSLPVHCLHSLLAFTAMPAFTFYVHCLRSLHCLFTACVRCLLSCHCLLHCLHSLPVHCTAFSLPAFTDCIPCLSIMCIHNHLHTT